MKRAFLLSALALSLASCSPYVLKSSGVLNGSNLASYKSFQLQEIEKESIPDDIMEPDVMRVYYVIANELKQRGYTQVESGADLTLYIGLTTKDSIETEVDNTTAVNGYIATAPVPIRARARRAWGAYNYYGPTPYAHAYYGDPVVTTEVVKNGVVMVDLVDNSDNNHVFCSQLSGKISGDQLILKDNVKLTEAAEKLFKKFPLPKTK